MERYFIRQFQKGDIEASYQLHRMLFPVPVTRQLMTDFLCDESMLCLCLFVIENDKPKLIGIANTRRSWASFFSTDRTAYLCMFGIHKDYRRKGLATDLLRIVCQILKNHFQTKQMYLHTQVINKAAIAFYEKFGFVQLSKIIGYYELPGEMAHAVYMELEFGGQEWKSEHEIELDPEVVELLDKVLPMDWMKSWFTSPQCVLVICV